MKIQNKNIFLKKLIPYIKKQNLDLHFSNGDSLEEEDYYNLMKLIVYGIISICAESNSHLSLGDLLDSYFIIEDDDVKFNMELSEEIKNYVQEHQEIVNGIALFPKSFDDIMDMLIDKNKITTMNQEV